MKLFTLPNILTLCNLFCGILACYFTIALSGEGVKDAILFCLGLSLMFDFFDGFVARYTKQNSEIGIQLDSLADVISFGLLPGLLMMKMLPNTFSGLYIHTVQVGSLWVDSYFILSTLGFFITLFSALRLAKFNLDTEQRYYFKGLNTPTNTIFIFSLYYLQTEKIELLYQTGILIGITFLSCYLLISNIPMMSLKLKGSSWKQNKLIYSFLLISLILLVIFKMYAVPFIITLYVFLSILFKKEIVGNTDKMV